MKAKYEIINHGYYNAQYFPGCGTAFSDFDNVVTGVGYDAKEAYQDAMEQVYLMIGDEAEKLFLPTRPAGIRKSDEVPCGDDEDINDIWWYVSIRF
jgi:hypothetical protein